TNTKTSCSRITRSISPARQEKLWHTRLRPCCWRNRAAACSMIEPKARFWCGCGLYMASLPCEHARKRPEECCAADGAAESIAGALHLPWRSAWQDAGNAISDDGILEFALDAAVFVQAEQSGGSLYAGVGEAAHLLQSQEQTVAVHSHGAEPFDRPGSGGPGIRRYGFQRIRIVEDP